jgi:hypothetical protein
MRGGLIGRIAGGETVTGQSATTQSERRHGDQPIRQQGKGLSARPADAAAHPDSLMLVIVGEAKPLSMTDDGVIPAQRTKPRQKVQGNHPGSMLSLVSASAIKRITAGVKAAADRPCQVSI